MPKIIDLSHLFYNEMPVYPGSEKPFFEQTSNIPEHGFAETKINMHSHNGTHMDAPAHMIENGKTLDKFEIDQFYGKGICIDCSKVKDANIDIQILETYENTIKFVDFILLYTGWSDKWGSKEYFSGFPVLNQEACNWLSEFKLKGIGLDNISIDKIDTDKYDNHNIILGKGMIIIENLTNLKLIGNEIFTFSCFPLKFINADGSPGRAVAIL